MSAISRRLVNARTIDLALRSSQHLVDCFEDSGEDTCARACASEHLSHLRAFTVTGTSASFPSPSAPPPMPPPASPAPPHFPFSQCSNLCEIDYTVTKKCTDGGKVNHHFFHSNTLHTVVFTTNFACAGIVLPAAVQLRHKLPFVRLSRKYPRN